ncbi:MAG: NAD(P)H-hydrate dehydratase [Ruminococcus sp.]|nr:NAD(P)H-hydrate dehydratase [Ruminococcus sp.]
MKTVTTAQMKELERKSDEQGVSYLQLMKNAGTALGQFTETLMKNNGACKVLFLCGSGNNGGDCFVAAQYLKNKGISACAALLCGIPQTETARAAFALMDGVTVHTGYDAIKAAVTEADVIVDGIFGTGFHGSLDAGIASLFNINTKAVRIAVDIPSGGNAQTGAVSEGCFQADYTITFGFRKFGMTQYPLREYCGKIIPVDIGIPEGCTAEGAVIEELSDIFVSGMLKKRSADSNKGTYGTLLSVTGSSSMPGAAMLSARAALRSGLGLLKQCMPAENIASFAAAFPEPVYINTETDSEGFYTSANADNIICLSEKSSAMLIGCGLGNTSETRKLVRTLIENSACPIILDADGINCIADCTEVIDKAQAGIVLTPHPGEMGRIFSLPASGIQNDRLGKCLEFTRLHKNAVLVLKGAGTLIAQNGTVYVNTTGNPGMSTGGSGDVLAGIIASFAAQGISLVSSAAAGVYIHGKAGDEAAKKYSMHGMLPTDIINELSQVFCEAERYI